MGTRGQVGTRGAGGQHSRVDLRQKCCKIVLCGWESAWLLSSHSFHPALI